MRLKATLLIWGGLVLCWLGVGVFPWGRSDYEGVTLADIGNVARQVTNGAAFPDPLVYLAFGFMFPLVATTVLAIFLPARAKALRIIVGIVYLLAGLGAAYGASQTQFTDPSEAWLRTYFFGAAALLIAAGALFLANRVWPFAALVGLLALAGAVWNTHVVITLMQDAGGTPGIGAIAVTVGYLLAAAGAFTAAVPPRRTLAGR